MSDQERNLINEAVADSINDFCYEQSMAESFLRNRLSPKERKAAERLDKIEFATGLFLMLSPVLFKIVEVLK